MQSKSLLRALTSAVLALGAGIVAPAFDLINFPDPDGPTGAWNGGSITMRIRMATSPTLQDGTNFATSARQAMLDWNAKLGRVQFLPVMEPPDRGENRNGVTEVFFDSTIYGQTFGSSTLAVTLVRPVSERDDGTLVFNEADVIFKSTLNWNSYRGFLQTGVQDFRRVAIHEFGHVLGLDHPDQAGQPVAAIMNSTVSSFFDGLQDDDIDGGQFLYGTPNSVIRPGNDLFANATAVTLNSGTLQLTGSNVGAFKEDGEPFHGAGEPGGASVWWKWIAPASGSLEVNTRTSNFDTMLAAYRGTTLTSLVQLAANDDEDPVIPGQNNPDRRRTSIVTINVDAGQTYYFAVDGWASESGSIIINFNYTPVLPPVPAFSSQPASSTVNEGQGTFFQVSATGAAPISYRWQRAESSNGPWTDVPDFGPYSGVFSTVLTVSVTPLSFSGTYFRCVATNTAGTTASNAALLTVNPLPVSIFQAPQSRDITRGGSATLTVGASGSAPLSYQWTFNGADISGATTDSYTITNAQPEIHGGSYRVRVTNGAGSVLSNAAIVTVGDPPAVTIAPETQSVIAGAPASFSAVITGEVSLIQWRRNGNPITGANSAVLAVARTTTADAGEYRVVVTNRFGTTTSAAATLVVTPATTSLGSSSQQLNAFGTIYSLEVQSNGGWDVSENADWLDVSVTQGLGDTTVRITAQPNVSSAPRSAPITFGGQTHTVTQTGLPAASRQLWVAGSDEFGQLGLGRTLKNAFWFSAASDAVRVFANGNVTAFIKSDGTLWVVGAVGAFFEPGATSGSISEPRLLMSNVASASIGGGFLLALKTDGTLWGVGAANSGVFGSNRETRRTPVLLASDVVRVSAGWSHALFVKSDGSLWGMGVSLNGQLGLGASNARAERPTQIATGVMDISAGSEHSLYIRTDGTLWGSGRNSSYQLGLGDNSDRFTFQQIAANVQSASAGGQHSFFIRTDGTLFGMGLGSLLGVGDDYYRTSPVPIASNVARVAAGGTHSVYLDNEAVLYGVGRNSDGQLGTGGFDDAWYPRGIFSPFKDIAAGSSHTAVIYADNRVFTVGANGEGQLAQSHAPVRPVSAKLAEGVTLVSVGNGNTFFVTDDGTAMAVGANLFGELGEAPTPNSPRNAPVSITANVRAIMSSTSHTVFLKNDGQLLASGANNSGAFGLPTGKYSQPVSIFSGVTAAGAGYDYTVMLQGTTLWGMGTSSNGELGLATGRSAPTELMDNVAAVAVKSQNTFVLRNDGTVWAAGLNSERQISPSSASKIFPFLQIATDVRAIASGGQHTLLLKRDNSLWGYGVNRESRLGQGAAATILHPVKIAEDVVAVFAGTFATAYLKSGGELWVMGANDRGQLATGSFLARTAPERVAAGVLSVALGRDHSAFITTGPIVPVDVAPVVTVQPGGSVSRSLGGSVTLSAEVVGTGTITYQWRRNGVPLVDATEASLTLTDLEATQSGAYDVVVTNEFGTTTSASVQLEVAGNAQTITFAPLADREFGEEFIQLIASASSGLPVSFELVSGPALLEDSTLMMLGYGVITVRATQDGGPNHDPAPAVERSFTVFPSFAAWRFMQFTEDDLTFPSISGPEADPDGDGLSNFLEYALGLRAKSADAPALEISAAQGEWTFNYRRPADRPDISYTVECSDDLTNWSSANVTHSLQTAADGIENWRAAHPRTSAPLFFRLKVVRL